MYGVGAGWSKYLLVEALLMSRGVGDNMVCIRYYGT